MSEVLEKLSKYQLRFAVATSAISIAILILSWSRLPPEVPLLYNNPWGQEQLVAPIWLWILPIVSFFINIIVFIICKKTDGLDPVLIGLILSTTIMFQIILNLGLWRIIGLML